MRRGTGARDGDSLICVAPAGVLFASLTVGFTAVADAADLDSFVFGVDEEDPVAADAEPQLFHAALERFEVSFAGLGEAVQGVEDAHGCWLIQLTDVGLGLVSPFDALHAGSR